MHIGREALLAHRTQVAPTGFFFRVPPEVTREIHPFEDFVLERSLSTPVSPRASTSTICSRASGSPPVRKPMPTTPVATPTISSTRSSTPPRPAPSTPRPRPILDVLLFGSRAGPVPADDRRGGGVRSRPPLSRTAHASSWGWPVVVCGRSRGDGAPVSFAARIRRLGLERMVRIPPPDRMSRLLRFALRGRRRRSPVRSAPAPDTTPAPTDQPAGAPATDRARCARTAEGAPQRIRRPTAMPVPDPVPGLPASQLPADPGATPTAPVIHRRPHTTPTTPLNRRRPPNHDDHEPTTTSHAACSVGLPAGCLRPAPGRGDARARAPTFGTPCSQPIWRRHPSRAGHPTPARGRSTRSPVL